jgi:hypothetical protein
MTGGTFKLRENCGNHRENGRQYEKGDIVESRLDLDIAFPLKFDRVETDPAARAPTTGPPATESTTGDPSGNDVTQDYPAAIDAGFTVRQSGSWFKVFSPSGAAISESLRSSAVEDWIQDEVATA